MSLATCGDKVTIRILRPDSTGSDSLVRVGFTSSTHQTVAWGQNGSNQRNSFRQLRDLLRAVPGRTQAEDPLTPSPSDSAP